MKKIFNNHLALCGILFLGPVILAIVTYWIATAVLGIAGITQGVEWAQGIAGTIGLLGFAILMLRLQAR